MQSLNIPQGTRNPKGYSSDEILRALRGIDGSRRWTFRYELLNVDNKKIMDLDRHVESCSVSQNFLAKIKRTASFDLRSYGEINFLNDRIKPYARLHMPNNLSEETESLDRLYYNNCNGTSGDQVTEANSQDNGDTLYVSGGPNGDVYYDTARAIAGGASVQVVSPNTVYSDPTFTSNQNQRTYYRIFFYVSSGGAFNVAGRLSDPSEPDYLPESMVTVDDASGNFTVSSSGNETDISSESANLVGQWVRVDVLSNELEGTYEWRFFWTDIEGSSADLTTTVEAAENQKMYGFYIFTEASVDIWFDRPAFGNYSIIPSQIFVDENNYVEWPLGVFLLSSPSRSTDADDVVTRTIEAYDAGKVFQDDKLEERYTVEQGDNYIEHIKTLLGNVPQIVEPDDTLAARTRDWPVGTEKEDLINDITQFINYESLTFDEDGRAVIRPYVLPDERSPEYEYADDEVSVMHPEVSQELDLFDIANKWIITVSNPDQEPIKAVLENNNPADPTSIPRRQRTIVDFREEQDVSDRGSLTKKIRRLSWEASRQFESIEFSTAIMPIHSYNDCYTINYGPLAVDNKYTEHKWEMDLEAGSEMTHRARRVVELGPDGNDSSFIEDNLIVTGTLDAGNIAFGRVMIPPVAPGRPSLHTVTGLDLKGSGEVHAQVCPDATRPDLVKEASVFAESPDGMKIWSMRSDDGGNDISVNWFMMRDL